MTYTQEELKEEKEKENALISNENEIFKLSKTINNKNKPKNSNNNTTNNLNTNLLMSNINNNIEHHKNNSNISQIPFPSTQNLCKSNINSIYSSSSNSTINNNNISNCNYNNINNNININIVNHKYSIGSINSKNPINLFSLSQKEKNYKVSPWVEKTATGMGTFKEKKGKNLSSKNNIINNFSKENKVLNNELNNTHYNSRYHSTSKNPNFNKHHLPKLRDLKINKKELNYINNNIRSIDITFNKVNSKNDDNEAKYYNNYNNINNNSNLNSNSNININSNNNTNINSNNYININNSNNYTKKDYNIAFLSEKKTMKNEIKLVSFTQNRIPSAKIKIMKSYPIMEGEIIVDENNPNLCLKNNDNEKKTSSNNRSNLRFNYILNNIDKDNNNMKCFSNKNIKLPFRPKSKTWRLKRDSNISNNGINKIYIDAGK